MMQSQLMNVASAVSSHLLNSMGLVFLVKSSQTPNFQWLVRQALTNRQNFETDVKPLGGNCLTGRLSQEALNDPFNLWRRDVIFKLIVKTVNAASLILLLRQVSHTRIATFLSKNPVLVALPVIIKAAEFALEYFHYSYRSHAVVEVLREKLEQTSPYLDALSHATFAWVVCYIPIENSHTKLAQTLFIGKVASVVLNAIAALRSLRYQGKPKSYEVSAALARLDLSSVTQSLSEKAANIHFQAYSLSIGKEDRLALLETMRDKALICFQNFCQDFLAIEDKTEQEKYKYSFLNGSPFYSLLHPSLFPFPKAFVPLRAELKVMREVVEQGYTRNANAGELSSFEIQLRTFQATLGKVKKLNTSPDVQKLLEGMLPMLIQDLPSQQDCQMLAQGSTKELQMKAGQYFLVFDSLKEIDSSSETLNQTIAILRPIAEKLSLIPRR